MKKTLKAVALAAGLTMLASPASTFAASSSTTAAKYTNQWVKKGSYWTYYNANGTLQKGWLLLGGKWYYFDANGYMKTGWVPVNGKWYFFNTNGTMKTGWAYISSLWYYFDSSGTMKTGWLKVGPDWYYLNANGAMKTGWLQSGGKWYYLDLSSGKMLLGWNRINGKVYFFYSNGMATNTVIEGKVIGADGAVVEGATSTRVSTIASNYGVTVEVDPETGDYDLYYGEDYIGIAMEDGLVLGDPGFAEMFKQLALALGVPATAEELNRLEAQAMEAGEAQSGAIDFYIDDETYMISWGSDE
jgi:hypothetical protein